MRPEFFVEGSASRVAWREGKATCPDCRRYGCRGQCGCGCDSCRKTPLESWDAGCCDVIREMRERSTPEGREAWFRRYRAGVGAAPSDVSIWREAVTQVLRAGCPPGIAETARRPEPRLAMESARHWWNAMRGGKPAVCFTGGTGTGKTVAAAWLAVKWAAQRKWWVGQPSGTMKPPLVWLVADDLARLSLLRDDDEQLIEMAGAAEFFVCDELPAIGGKAGLLALTQLLCRRLDSRKPLLITTNAKGKELSIALGAHFADRLKAAHLIEAGTHSMRGAA